MDGDKINNSDLKIELSKNEIFLDEVNKKIRIVLDKSEVIDKEYEELIGNKIQMEETEIRKNKKYIALGKVFVIISSLIKILVGGILVVLVASIFDILKILLSLYCVISGILFALLGGCELYSFLKTISNEKILCKDLGKSLKYNKLLEQIKEKEREKKYLDMEYEKLIKDRDDIELAIDSLMVAISRSTSVREYDEKNIEEYIDVDKTDVRLLVRKRSIHNE